jgi:hypothetical protein
VYIILSQKRDTESRYMDKLFSVYHFPPQYRNQIHSGDTFIYYQGDRLSKKHRYYYGTGRIGNIYQTSNLDYYAELIDCHTFNSVVPIYRDNGYIEQIDFQTIRKSLIPPWQSSIRPLSDNAAKYILTQAGGLKPEADKNLQIELENELKSAIKNYYRDGNKIALKDVISTATQLAGLLGVMTDDSEDI